MVYQERKMVTKIQDGSIVLASDLLSGAAEDQNGNKIKFKEIEGSDPATFRAEVPLNDGTGRVNIYTFSIATTSVRVSEIQQTQEQFKMNQKAQAEKNQPPKTGGGEMEARSQEDRANEAGKFEDSKLLSGENESLGGTGALTIDEPVTTEKTEAVTEAETTSTTKKSGKKK